MPRQEKTKSPPKTPQDQTYPADMEGQRGEPSGEGRNKPGPKNPPEAATVEDDEDDDS